MWHYLLKLGLVAAFGVGLGLVVLWNQESIQEGPLNNNSNSPRSRRRNQNTKSKRKAGGNQKQLLEKQINSGTLSCSICFENVSFRDKVWSCSKCWNIFHLACISKWAEANRAHKNCPACREVILENFPLQYKCMCGRIKEPRWRPGVTPHCCGQKCSRGCDQKCHPGPCD